MTSLFSTERPVAAAEVATLRAQWQQLRRDNAPFRRVSGDALVSAPIDHFDPMLLRLATSEWQDEISIIGTAIGDDEAYLQTGDMMLKSRVVALVEQGKLLADGDPRDIRACRIRLP